LLRDDDGESLFRIRGQGKENTRGGFAAQIENIRSACR
jgi:hypothetical protein